MPLILALALLLGVVTPALATDPIPSPTPGPAPADVPAPLAGAEAMPTSVHAEMLAAHADDAVTFTAGGPPSVALTGPAAMGLDGGATLQAAGAVAGLPNGLRREVFGYLPYWYMSASELQYLDYGLLSTIAYFGVAARGDGTLAVTTAQGQPTAGWAGWTSSAMTEVTNRAHALGVKVVLTVTMMSWNGDYAAVTALLNDPTSRASLISRIAAAVRDRGADGVNLDFEPMPSSLRSEYSQFVREVKQGLLSAGAGSYLTVATMAGAATWSSGYDVAALTASGAADAIMVMAYDFSWSGSARAGGVAPIDSAYIFDAREALNDHLGKVPASKIIWGVPYYGRAWTTQDGTQNAFTCRTGELCPQADAGAIGRTWAPRYVDALSGVAQHGRLWDPAGRVPWYHYWDASLNVWTQAYYDDAQSLGEKYALVEANGLRGIGIWTLLMDTGRTELYDVIDSYFQGTWFYDILGSQFFHDILWLGDSGITSGCGGELFCPGDAVTRGQMAAFLARAFGLPPAGSDFFTDDAGNIFQADINRLAASGIASGCGGGRFCPNAPVTRGEMAAFLVRGLGLPPAAGDHFSDDATSQFQSDINRLAEAGISTGCGGGRFCPNAPVTRGEMAAFLRRALDS